MKFFSSLLAQIRLGDRLKAIFEFLDRLILWIEEKPHGLASRRHLYLHQASRQEGLCLVPYVGSPYLELLE